MVVLKDKNNNKILRSNSGVVLLDSESVGSDTKILDINGSLQVPNMVFKSDVDNSINQITDRAQNIPFAQSDVANRPVYNYGDGESYIDFDGVNDFLEAKNSNLNFLNENKWSISFWSYVNATGDVGFFSFFDDTSNRFSFLYSASVNRYRVFYVNGGSSELDIQFNRIPTQNTWEYVTLSYTGTGFKFSIAGQQFAEVPATYNKPTKYNNIYLGAHIIGSGALYYMKGYLSAFEITNTDKITNGFIEPNIAGFTHYKRFQNKDETKKLFLTSNYTEGADINDANEITSIVDEIQNTQFTVDAGTVKRDKFGLSSNNGRLEGIVQNVQNVDSFYFSYWCRITDSNYSFSSHAEYTTETGANDILLFSNLYNRQGSNTFGTYIWGSSTQLNSSVTAVLGSWYHLALKYDNGTWYFFVNGVLEATHAFLISSSDRTAMKINLLDGKAIYTNPMSGSVDDVFLSVNDSLIDPTTWTSKPKKLEPLKRKSFNDKIIQYQIP